MRLSITNVLATAGLAVLTACGSGNQSSSGDEAESDVLTLTKAPASPAYDEASLSLDALDVLEVDSTYEGSFSFSVNNYELGVQTADASERGIANSGKGQHIHFIANNGPYSAHYEPTFTKQLEEGNHVLLAFLSRSYHESVKNASAYYIDVVTVGNPSEETDVDLSAPHMFYSRPKGTYVGDDVSKLMIDFYLLNTSISPNGNKVRATVNGQEFLIDEWAPYYIEGLAFGTVTVQLELIDASGNLIPGPFNSVTREVTLKESE